MKVRRRVITVLAAAAMSMGLMAGPAAAQPLFTGGLVNVTVNDVIDVENVRLGVGIAIAANICGVNVAALAQEFTQTGTGDCTSETGDVVKITQA